MSSQHLQQPSWPPGCWLEAAQMGLVIKHIISVSHETSRWETSRAAAEAHTITVAAVRREVKILFMILIFLEGTCQLPLFHVRVMTQKAYQGNSEVRPAFVQSIADQFIPFANAWLGIPARQRVRSSHHTPP